MKRRTTALTVLLLVATACGERAVPPSVARSGAPGATGSILDPHLRTGGSGTPCVAVGDKPGDPDGAAASNNEQRTLRMLRSHPPCADATTSTR